MSSGKGKRTPLAMKPNKGKIIKDLETRVQNLEMSIKVSQMLVRQLMENMQPIQTDLSELAMRQRDLQYRALAFQELTSLVPEKVQELSTELQIKDFHESSDKEDVEQKLTVTDVVAEDSAVILTSVTPSETPDKGILRSKLVLAEIQFPDLRDALLGKKVGDKFSHTINNVNHDIEIVGIRTIPVTEPLAEEIPAVKAVDTEVKSESVEVQ